MASLILASLFFIAIHLGISGTRFRDAIVARVGSGGYLGLFSLLSILGVVWMCRAYNAAPFVVLWGDVSGLRHLGFLVVLLAFVFVVLGMTTPNPTLIGGDALLAKGQPADAVRGVLRVTRHPFLCGVALWALTHLMVNGDLAGLIFFGTFAFVAIVGPSSLDRRRARTLGSNWDEFAKLTSALPFLAIAQGRTHFALGELGWWRLLLALVIYMGFLLAHEALFGVSPLSG